ncbi:hypothetical protein ACLIUU_002054 [Citrobacter werkmanii]|uniref:hypothetical protein n=1 Tax=Citrobacter werkmanii TaxID=67827 RepID=UPI00157586C6|nr:hypothetical protein [Citrobacter werkmanii]NTY81119.1 hypothetical protein [Citrobacter werkmanii]
MRIGALGPVQQNAAGKLGCNSLSGDRAREAAKQAAESLKNQVREKLGEGGKVLC